MSPALFALGAGIPVVVVLVGVYVWRRSYRRVPEGKALVIDRRGEVVVAFKDTLVLPIIGFAEEVDLRKHHIPVDARGRDAFRSKDGARVELRAVFAIQINRDEYDVLKVTQAFGCDGAGDPRRLAEVFTPSFREALKVVVATCETATLVNDRDRWLDQVVLCLGQDLNGIKLDEITLEHFEVAPR